MPSTITPNKTVDITAAVAWQDIATANQVISSAISVGTSAGKRAVRFFIKLARRSGTAFTAGWPNVRIEASSKSTGNSDWIPLYSYQMGVGASIANTTLNGAVSAGATSFVVTAATNIAVGDMLYLGDSSASNWELVRVKSVSGTTITPEEAVTFAHASGSAVTDQAEVASPAFGCVTFSRLRVVVDNAGGGQTVAAEVAYTTYDSDGAT